VEVVAGGPAWHRALLDAVDEAARLRFLEERHEIVRELLEVLIHAERLVSPDEAANRVDAEEGGRVEHAEHEVHLLFAQPRVVVEHVVEVGDVGNAHARLFHGDGDAVGALSVEGLPQVERIGDRIQHRLGRHVGLGGVERGRDLNVVGADLAPEAKPILDGAVGVLVAQVSRRELLKCGRQDAELHVFRGEGFHGHR
jgi:hypothetical protein